MKIWKLIAVTLTVSSLVACASSRTKPDEIAVDSSLSFTEAMDKAIRSNGYISGSLKKRDPRYVGEAVNEYQSTRAALRGKGRVRQVRNDLRVLAEKWCGANAGTMNEQKIMQAIGKNNKAYVIDVKGFRGYDDFGGAFYGYTCDKDGIPIGGIAIRTTIVTIDGNTIVQARNELGIEKAKYEQERAEKAARKAAEEARWAELSASIRMSPELGQNVSVKTCAVNPRNGECMTISRYSNGQVMQVTSNKALVRLFSGEELWVSHGELNAPR